MKDIWILISNVVYFIFAFLLIFIAVMNIVGGGKDKYQLKTAMPKFIVGILIVPFSWFAVQFILSLASFMSTVSLSLPYDTFQGMTSFKTSISGKEICNDFYMVLAKDKNIVT